MHKFNIQKIIIYIFLLFIVTLTFYPVVWMFVTSFRLESSPFGKSLFESGSFGIKNYINSLNARPFLLYLFNSTFVALVSVIITIIVGACAGYSLAKFKYRLSNFFWIISLSSIMIPLEAIVIPLYLEINAFGWTNTYAGLILPTAFNVVAIFIFRQSIKEVPDELIEASRIDGASELRILFSVIMPVIIPTVIVVAVLTFTLSWNSYLWPLVVVSDDELRTLPLGMASYQKSYGTRYTELMAVSVYGAIPTLLFFIALQRYFIESAITTGIKG